MIYEVSHRTVYDYSVPVSISHHLLHLAPRDSAFQTCRDTAVEISPPPSVRAPGVDYFGNPTTFVTIQQSHRELVLHALSIIEVAERHVPDPAATPPWEAVRDLRCQDRSAEALQALEFTFASPYVAAAAELRTYAAASFTPGRPILAAARELTHRIFKDFKYDPRATTVRTGVAESFAMRRGVCQDFAHIQIACLRALGLPARYVSGYLLTRPPDGQGAAGRCRRLARLARGLAPGPRLGRPRPDQRPHPRPRAHHGRLGPRLWRRQPGQRRDVRRRRARRVRVVDVVAVG